MCLSSLTRVRAPTLRQTKWNSKKAYALSKDSTFAQQYWSSIYWSFTALVKVHTHPSPSPTLTRCSVLDKCRARDDAMLVLMRPSSPTLNPSH